MFERMYQFLNRNKKIIPLLGVRYFFLFILIKLAYVLGIKSLAMFMFKKYSVAVKLYVSNNISYTISNLSKPMEDKKVNQTGNIWVCWFQGEENAPDIVKACVNSIRRHANGMEVVLVTMDNFNKYVNFPEFILEKLESGCVSLTHFSDILRSALLYMYGGLWIDSTSFLTRDIDHDWFGYEFYSIKKKDKGLNVSESLWCGYFMAGNKGNLVHELLYKGLLEYWTKTDAQVDYLLIDYIIRVGYENNTLIKKMIDSVSYNNEYVEFFLKHDRDLLNEDKYREIMKTTYCFKLTYKKRLGLVNKSYGQRFVSDHLCVSL